jgi:hypothetical protein
MCGRCLASFRGVSVDFTVDIREMVESVSPNMDLLFEKRQIADLFVR